MIACKNCYYFRWRDCRYPAGIYFDPISGKHENRYKEFYYEKLNKNGDCQHFTQKKPTIADKIRFFIKNIRQCKGRTNDSAS